MKTPVFPLCYVCFVYEFLCEKFVLNECVGLSDERSESQQSVRGCITNVLRKCYIPHIHTHLVCVNYYPDCKEG